MKTSVHNLRNSMKTILSAVQHGNIVTVYSHERAIAEIRPITTDKEEEDYGFGMWSDHLEMKNINKYMRKLRKGRKHDL